MATLNKVQLIGNLGRNPEARPAADDQTLVHLSVATTEVRKDDTGARKEEPEWHRVVLFGQQAEFAREYLSKGRLVYVEGRLQTRKWQDADGQDHYLTEVIGEQIQALGPRPGSRSPEPVEHDA